MMAWPPAELSVPGLDGATAARQCGPLAALALCLWVDHASMAVLVWVMAVAASALVVALTLTWRPRWLRSVAWVCGKKE